MCVGVLCVHVCVCLSGLCVCVRIAKGSVQDVSVILSPTRTSTYTDDAIPTCKRSKYFQTRHLSSMRTTTAFAGTAARWHRSYSSRPASVPSGHSSFRSSSSRSRAQDSWFLPEQDRSEGVSDLN